ncbi:phage tail protein [Marixanthomonas spongiae]|uniref:Phage tail protein n=1 Tax=Marixanthomonas spongiae TaxID=2174845 RepID=A0A2U0HWG0_9FLAO|nr:phage tail protein [Marixanthomonas spongiae]PVW13195.1 phage tail protein [Marixanthomonas spongiae]
MEELPLVNFHFRVDWGGTRIGFTEVTGLDMEYEVLEYRHGASLEFSTQKLPGLRKFRNIVLKRGMHKNDNDFFKWFDDFRQSKERRDITISLLNEEHEPTVVWKVRNTWPVSIKYSGLHATKTEVFIERMELTHEGIQVENGSDSE